MKTNTDTSTAQTLQRVSRALRHMPNAGVAEMHGVRPDLAWGPSSHLPWSLDNLCSPTKAAAILSEGNLVMEYKAGSDCSMAVCKQSFRRHQKSRQRVPANSPNTTSMSTLFRTRHARRRKDCCRFWSLHGGLTAAVAGAQTSQTYEAQGCKMACCNRTRSYTDLAHSSLEKREKTARSEAQALLWQARIAWLRCPFL